MTTPVIQLTLTVEQAHIVSALLALGTIHVMHPSVPQSDGSSQVTLPPKVSDTEAKMVANALGLFTKEQAQQLTPKILASRIKVAAKIGLQLSTFVDDHEEFVVSSVPAVPTPLS